MRPHDSSVLQRWFRKLAKVAAGILAGLVVLAACAIVLTARPGDPALWPPAPGASSVELHVVSHGYHAGLAIPREAIRDMASRTGDAALLAVAQRFGAYSWIEIGWGDEGFYRLVPSPAALTARMAFRALFLPGNASVVHVVGLPDHPRRIFTTAEMVPVRVSLEGFSRLLKELDATFARQPAAPFVQELGQGLYGPSLFYRGVGTFHIFNVCNQWVARLLSAAGVPTAPALAVLPQGLMLDLKWRSGLVPLAPGVEQS